MTQHVSPFGAQRRRMAKCSVDYCGQKSSPTANKMGMCFRHGEIMQLLLWALPRIKVEAPKGSPIWTPDSGQPSGILQKGE